MLAILALRMLRQGDPLGSLASQHSPYLVNSRKITDFVSIKIKIKILVEDNWQKEILSKQGVPIEASKESIMNKIWGHLQPTVVAKPHLELHIIETR